MKQTALEWLIEQFKEYDFEDSPTMYIMQIPSWVLEKKELQAKEMEKQQIIDAYQQGFNNAYFSDPLIKEQYYKKTFNK
jgi:hypothetical protein